MGLRHIHEAFDKSPESAILCAIEMNTTFTKQIKTHAPAMVSMAKWQRCSRLANIVGTKF